MDIIETTGMAAPNNRNGKKYKPKQYHRART
jgi:hypothetical protein